MIGCIYETVRTQPMCPASGSLLMIFSRYLPDAGRGPSLLGRGPHPTVMAKAKTGYFTLTQDVALAQAAIDGSRFTATIDMGAYVDVGDRQAVSISEVSYIWQNGNANDSNPEGMLALNGSLGIQVTDQNPNAVFTRATNSHLIASGHLNIDVANNVTSHHSDMFPDNFGSPAEEKNIISDTLFLVAGNDGADIGGNTVHCTVLIRCRIVTLTQKDYYAIAVAASASD